MRQLKREADIEHTNAEEEIEIWQNEPIFEMVPSFELEAKEFTTQLAHRLWTDIEDMEHFTKSGTFKEIFGLNFAPQFSSRKSFC